MPILVFSISSTALAYCPQTRDEMYLVTGVSTGVHLHISVMDCALFDPTDANCSNLNSYFYYSNRRINEGYLGLGSMMLVPGEWNSR